MRSPYLVFFMFAMSGCGRSSDTSPEIAKGLVAPLTLRWEFAGPHPIPPEGLTGLSARNCGTCHLSHYEEWQLSTHALAWKDLQFQAELRKDSSPFMCINCHIPLQNQQASIIKGLEDGDIYKPVKERNPHFDADLREEGINCGGCHARDGSIIGPTGNPDTPHATRTDTAFLSEQLCISCHNANAVITPTLACTFQTGDEWRSGPFYGKKKCIDSHQPQLTRPTGTGFPDRPTRQPFVPGSGDPNFASVQTKILN